MLQMCKVEVGCLQLQQRVAASLVQMEGLALEDGGQTLLVGQQCHLHGE